MCVGVTLCVWRSGLCVCRSGLCVCRSGLCVCVGLTQCVCVNCEWAVWDQGGQALCCNRIRVLRA